MKLVTFQRGGAPSEVGVLSDGDTSVIPLGEIGGAPGFDSMQSIIEGGEPALDRIRNLPGESLPGETESVPLGDVRLLAPLPRPVQIRDVLCFLEHMLNAGRVAAKMRGTDPAEYEVPQAFIDAPRYYKANRMAVIGPDHDIQTPAGCSMLDYELELGIIIGRRGKDIAAEDALDHVFGYTIFNDVSARDLQMEEMASGLGPAKGKDFDTGNVFGPCIVTADSVNPTDMTMSARLNGEAISSGNTSQMNHTVTDAIAYVSRNETIYPGEILGSGTVPLGCLLEHGRSLSPGDVIELEIEGIGILRNMIATE